MLVCLLTPLLMGIAPLTSCDHSTEARLIGTWRAIDTTYEGKHAFMDVTLRADHTAAMATGLGDKALPNRSGRWHAQGDQLFIAWDDNPPEVRETKARIVKLSNDTLITRLFEFDHEDPQDARTWNMTSKRIK
jgi:hypothetical protein